MYSFKTLISPIAGHIRLIYENLNFFLIVPIKTIGYSFLNIKKWNIIRIAIKKN